jgi:LSD1 subclass zinc finger protein
MDDRVCPLVSGRNGLLVYCIGEDCPACRTALTVPDGETVCLCAACDSLPVSGGTYPSR